MRRNNVQNISWGQSMQTFVKSYQFVLIPANLKRFPTKFLKEFVYTTKALFHLKQFLLPLPGRVAQLVTCLATDACLTADPGVASSIPSRSHTFVEIDHEIISTVIPLPSAVFQEGLLSVTSESMCTNYWLTACSSLPRKKCG